MKVFVTTMSCCEIEVDDKFEPASVMSPNFSKLSIDESNKLVCELAEQICTKLNYVNPINTEVNDTFQNVLCSIIDANDPRGTIMEW